MKNAWTDEIERLLVENKRLFEESLESCRVYHAGLQQALAEIGRLTSRVRELEG